MSTKSATAIDKAIGAKIREARTAKGLSQEKLAGHLGITFQQLQKYEKAGNRISAGRLAEIAHFLGISIDWFYGTDPNAGKAPTPNQELANKIGTLPREVRNALETLIDWRLA